MSGPQSYAIFLKRKWEWKVETNHDGRIVFLNSMFKHTQVNLLVAPASASGAECPLPLFFVSFPQGLGHCSYSSSFDNCLSQGSPWSLEKEIIQKFLRQHFLFTGLLSLPRLPTSPTQGDRSSSRRPDNLNNLAPDISSLKQGHNFLFHRVIRRIKQVYTCEVLLRTMLGHMVNGHRLWSPLWKRENLTCPINSNIFNQARWHTLQHI